MNKPTSMLRPAIVLAAMLSLAGCALTPAYERPALAVPAALPDVVGASSSASADASATPKSLGVAATSPAQAAAELPWASYFPDARLQGLIRQALDNNRDLRVAVLNIEQLRAAYQIQDADRFPTLNGVGNASRARSTAKPFAYGNSVQAGIQVSAYELDLFGRVKALTETAGAQLMASEEARKAAHISLVASVANAYYALWADRWQLALAEQTLSTRQDSFKLLQLKFDNGVLNELDLRSGQSLVEAARVTRAQAQRQWAQDLSALNLLLGSTASSEQLPPEVSVNMLAPATSKDSAAAAQSVLATLWPGLSELPVGVSSDVLLQRPDIAQAEQALIGANANIGAARAARFPRISLTASAGVASTSLTGLFDGGLFGASIAPSISVPLLDAGRTKAGVDAAYVKRDIAVAQYDKAIQAAFKEVADALVARRTYADQADAQLAQAQAEAARLRLSTMRYDAGVANQLDLLDAQRSLFATQQSLIAAQLARQQAHISVYKALGGGWVSDAKGGVATSEATSVQTATIASATKTATEATSTKVTATR
jgi:multidrug efflux system outer membrane protein